MIPHWASLNDINGASETADHNDAEAARPVSNGSVCLLVGLSVLPSVAPLHYYFPKKETCSTLHLPASVSYFQMRPSGTQL